MVLAASHAFLGHIEDAQKAIARLQLTHPNWSISNLPDLTYTRRAEHRERFREGLRKAGLPE